MGTIDIIKRLSTLISSAVNKSQQHQDKNSWECRESNPGLLGEKQVCHLCAMQAPQIVTWSLTIFGTAWLESAKQDGHRLLLVTVQPKVENDVSRTDEQPSLGPISNRTRYRSRGLVVEREDVSFGSSSNNKTRRRQRTSKFATIGSCDVSRDSSRQN